MSDEQRHIVRLLRSLQERLETEGQRDAARRVSTVAVRLTAAEHLDPALDTLYGVCGWDRVAVLLMWEVERLRRLPAGSAEMSDDARLYHLDELRTEVLSSGDREEQALHPRPPGTHAPEKRPDLGEALQAFAGSLEALRRGSIQGEAFLGLNRESLERVRAEASVVDQQARTEQRDDVSGFALAVGGFITYVLDKRLEGDIRIIHLIENANLTLQTALQTAGEEDFDSLHQTIQLLQHPQTLLT